MLDMSPLSYPLTWVDVCLSVSKIHERRELKIKLAFQFTLNGTSFHRPRNQSLMLNKSVLSLLHTSNANHIHDLQLKKKALVLRTRFRRG